MREEKQYLLKEMQEQLEGVSSFVVFSYEKLSPNVSWNFRTSLREAGAILEVVKKRVFLKALEEQGIAAKLSDLKGNIGIIFSTQDVVQASKQLVEFNKDNENILHPSFAWSEQVLYAANEVVELAKLPSQDQMRAQFLGLLEAPMAQTLSVMQSLLTSVAYCLENKAKSS